jgi:hypothetical protein
MRERDFHVIDKEPAPHGLPVHLHGEYGFSMYSARYGNIYTPQQLVQLAREAILGWKPSSAVWQSNGNRYFDAFRPSIEPTGLSSPEEITIHRQMHLQRVKQVFLEMDVFIFTFGLTEAWIHKDSGTVFPTAPGVIAGNYEESEFEFRNFNYVEVIESFLDFMKIIDSFRGQKKQKIYSQCHLSL